MGCKKYFSTYATNALPNKNEISTNEIVSLFPPGVRQHLVVYQSFIGRHPKNVFFFISSSFLLTFDGKNCGSTKCRIYTLQTVWVHQFTGQNTQHFLHNLKINSPLCTPHVFL